MADLLSRLQASLAGRYQVQRELGRGGMATVLLAIDVRHERPVAIKVLRPELAAALGPDRFLREIHTTAQLTHPHILPVLDSGEADGSPYYVMPYVEGESLRARLEREGPLPIDVALSVVAEAADALAYAHERGVIHRDIKPENILFEAGHAVVADFGIARAIHQAAGEALTSTGIVLGTPAYMSPEQSAGDREVDPRSDLYSLGCVLYEMLVGEPPFTGPSMQAVMAKRATQPPPRASVLRSAVPPALDAALGKALSPVAGDRYGTAREFADALAAARATSATAEATARAGSRRGTRLALALGLGAAAVLLGTTLLSSSGVDFAARDWVVLAALDNETGDSVFEGSLDAALTVGLQQSRHVNVLPRPQIVGVLRQMRRPDSTRLDEAVAREVALRANVRVLVVPAIGRIDSTYLLTTRIVDPTTTADLRTRSARAEGKSNVLGALDDLVRQLRRDLGESRQALAENGVRLDLATTPSLDALRAWTEGNRYWNTRRFDDALERYRTAVDLDPGFAMAHKMIGAYFTLHGRRDSSDAHFGAALAGLDRVTEREQLLIQAAFQAARGNQDGSIRTQETYVERYPDDLSELYNLGSVYMRARRDDDAIRVLSRVVAIDSGHAEAMINIATAYALKGEYAEGFPYYRRAFALRPDYRLSGNLNHEFGISFLRLGHPDSAVALFQEMLAGSQDQQASGHRSLAIVRMYQGRYAEAREHLEQAVRLTRLLQAPVSEFRNRLYLASAQATSGLTPEFLASLRAAKAIADTVYLAPEWLARLAGAYARVPDTVALGATLATIRARANDENGVDQVSAMGTEARLALARGDHGRVVELLQEIRLFPHVNWQLYEPMLGEALHALGRLDEAIAADREHLASLQSLGWEAQEGWLLAHARLARLLEERGDTTAALEYHDRLLRLWEHGDPDLPPLRETRRRAALLRRSPMPGSD